MKIVYKLQYECKKFFILFQTNQLYEPPLQEASSSLEGNTSTTEGKILSESSLSVDSDSLVNYLN